MNIGVTGMTLSFINYSS